MTVDPVQIGDGADRQAQMAEARQEELLTKEFASKTRVEEHRSESHEEARDGKVTKKNERHSDRVAEGSSVRDNE